MAEQQESAWIPSSGDVPAVQKVRDDYMKYLSDVFTDELVELYELDGSNEAVKQLTACLECGVAVYGHPITVDNPSLT
ncbi:hypothetical protein LBRM_35_7210 [Leishmania braziliensis MHOM/BR/75/M2904]|uniref:Uncharacterized protein n=2 Tax=Leishmania braziliensis TaxID=5660 RepID=A4HQK5_LEIBR|nr:hypothetical protein LBRM_35_7210 [Leishmania braziliensis MHOM/BR/75/M2904]KAI5691739.1 hypothetical protein MNV84_08476 [Leishmania braziliensis]CAJ2482380.1 unnamed protein product [Leishmania braziliensis]CAJ2482602.1 unnamed protein product [Leishmania braziliensis]CAM44474.1 hypothetical protein LBRM_35_7210 [Leishmania braziliensis MHOM/BR/75/M2904]SYZ70553.1 hypothetical_protein [Leishmania braziliensis MHOM/BR/75/M2904]